MAVTRRSACATVQPRLFAWPADDAPHADAPPRRRAQRSNAAAPARGLGLCVLGSGSGGNCSVVRHREHAILVDAGFSPRRTFTRLQQVGIDPERLAAVCVTHLDRDHFRPQWVRTLRERSVRLCVHRWHRRELAHIEGAAALDDAGLVQCFDGEAFEPASGLSVSAVPLPHDDKGTVGFVMRSDAGSLGYATDLGHVPHALIEQFAGVDLIAIEANFDPQMQVTSTRPWFLKQRIMGKHGHLSNEQAFEAVCRIADRSPSGLPRHVVLLHRSRQCNHPRIIRRLFARDPRLARRITLTEQRRRSRWCWTQSVKPLQRHQMPIVFDPIPVLDADGGTGLLQPQTHIDAPI